jgi:erythromycin esterase-like protein
MDTNLIDRIHHHAVPLVGGAGDYMPLLDQIGDRSIVLLGEATHGTHEFYSARFEITKKLIEEKGFTAVALEADWPDCIGVNRYIHSHGSESHLVESVSRFKRFPVWMWRNSDFLEMVEWLFVHNHKESTPHQVSVYGMDLYSLFGSLREVIVYLDRVDPQAANQARKLYSCFDHFERDPIQYGREIRLGVTESCEEEAVQQLLELDRKAVEYLASDGLTSPDELFFAQWNAQVVKSAERYYRGLFTPTINTWNLRDTHMADTIDALLAYLRTQGRPQKVVLWAHNSHVGDERASEMGRRRQINIGQLLRERHPDNTFSVGFTTYRGSVVAADEWDEPPQIKLVRPAIPESWEAVFHETGLDAFYLDVTDPDLRPALLSERLERAIGVIYSPQTERLSHYFHSRLADRFDAVIHFDHSREVEPIDRLFSREDEIAPPSHLQF